MPLSSLRIIYIILNKKYLENDNEKFPPNLKILHMLLKELNIFSWENFVKLHEIRSVTLSYLPLPCTVMFCILNFQGNLIGRDLWQNWKTAISTRASKKYLSVIIPQCIMVELLASGIRSCAFSKLLERPCVSSDYLIQLESEDVTYDAASCFL